eukprot:gene19217-25068_t
MNFEEEDSIANESDYEDLLTNITLSSLKSNDINEEDIINYNINIGSDMINNSSALRENHIEDNIGMNSPSWISFLNNFPSKKFYESRVNNFNQWVSSKGSNDLIKLLIDYFEEKYNEIDQSGNLKEKAPIIESNISKWEKTYNVTKSKTLTKDDLRLLHQLPNAENTLLYKVYSAIAMAFAARGCEITYLNFNQVERFHNDNNGQYVIKYTRSKNSTVRDSDQETALILGHCLRRSSATICANAGLTIPQMKNVTGQHSDTVVQGYIHKSNLTKEISANAISIDPIETDDETPISTLISNNMKKRKFANYSGYPNVSSNMGSIDLSGAQFHGEVYLFESKK